MSVPDDVYRAARVAAAERGTSVSALVAAHLRGIAEGEPAQAESRRRQLIEEISARHPNFDPAENVSRDQLYDRDVR